MKPDQRVWRVGNESEAGDAASVQHGMDIAKKMMMMMKAEEGIAGRGEGEAETRLPWAV